MGFGPGGGGGFGAGQVGPRNRRFAEEMEKNLSARLNLQQGVQSAATASQLGDFFQYTIKTPVNLPRQKSALLPIANNEVEPLACRSTTRRTRQVPDARPEAEDTTACT